MALIYSEYIYITSQVTIPSSQSHTQQLQAIKGCHFKKENKKGASGFKYVKSAKCQQTIERSNHQISRYGGPAAEGQRPQEVLCDQMHKHKLAVPNWRYKDAGLPSNCVLRFLFGQLVFTHDIFQGASNDAIVTLLMMSGKANHKELLQGCFIIVAFSSFSALNRIELNRSSCRWRRLFETNPETPFIAKGPRPRPASGRGGSAAGNMDAGSLCYLPGAPSSVLAPSSKARSP